MSIAWSRIFPEGRGTPNQRGIDYYNRVVDGLLGRRDRRPTSPCSTGTCRRRLPGGGRTATRRSPYADYAGFMAGKLSDRVHNFMTVNELRCFTDLGHQSGVHAPGLKLPTRPR